MFKYKNASAVVKDAIKNWILVYKKCIQATKDNFKGKTNVKLQLHTNSDTTIIDTDTLQLQSGGPN